MLVSILEGNKNFRRTRSYLRNTRQQRKANRKVIWFPALGHRARTTTHSARECSAFFVGPQPMFGGRRPRVAGGRVNRPWSRSLLACLPARSSRINARRKYLSKRLRIDSSVVSCLLSLPFQMSISFRIAPNALSGVGPLFIFLNLPSFWI